MSATSRRAALAPLCQRDAARAIADRLRPFWQRGVLESVDVHVVDELGALLREADPAREGLVYTLTLLLSRKRRVKIRESRHLPEGDLLQVLVRRAEEDDEVSVRAPRLSDDDVDGLQAELEKLFDFGGNGTSQPTESA